MVVFIDSNIILDVMISNVDFHDESQAVISVPKSKFDLYISAASCTDIFYVANRTLHNAEFVKFAMKNLLKAVSVAGVDESCIHNALNSDWCDFEDSVQHEVAQQIKADILVTRNASDYAHSAVRVMSPAEFLTFANEN